MNYRNYYCLVAGLPDITPEHGRLPFTLAGFRQELKNHIHPDDYRMTELLFLPADNRNLLNMLLKNNSVFDETGTFSHEELEEEIKEPDRIPDYLKTFLFHFKSSQPLFPGQSWEDQLTSLYYNHVKETGNDFLKKWFEIEMNIKNVLIALTARHHKIQVEGFLVGKDSVTDAIQKSLSRDFGLSAEYPYVEKLIMIFESKNLLEREKAIDRLKWSIIDEINVFNYFSIEVIQGYLIKLAMVERWMKLDTKTGEEMFRRLVNDLENSYEFPKEFSI